jgi:transposase
MRGKDWQSDNLFSYIRLEPQIPADHPLRPIRKLVDEALLELSPAFRKLYSREGWPSIPPERLFASPSAPGVLYGAFERLLMEQLEYNLLFRWFVGLSIDDRGLRP